MKPTYAVTYEKQENGLPVGDTWVTFRSESHDDALREYGKAVELQASFRDLPHDLEICLVKITDQGLRFPEMVISKEKVRRIYK